MEDSLVKVYDPSFEPPEIDCEFNDIISWKDKPLDDALLSYTFNLDNYQRMGCYGISVNENVLITAHTGSGKTVLAEFAIACAIKKGKKVIYTSPIKALSNQKYHEFLEKFGKHCSVGIMTGDKKINPDATLIIMTTEILRNILLQNKDENMKYNYDNIDIDDVERVVFDEVHYINDDDRGKVWETCLIRLKSDVNLIMLSATINNAEYFSGWLAKIKNKVIHLITTEKRAVPLKHYYAIPKIEQQKFTKKFELLEIVNSKEEFKGENLMLAISQWRKVEDNYRTILTPFTNYLFRNDLLPAVYFVFSKKKCDEYVNYIHINNMIDSQTMHEVETIYDSHLRKFKDHEQYRKVKELVMNGIGIHHSGLLAIIREVVEKLYSMGYIKVLFATETFAIGINMPTRTVVFTDLEKPSSKSFRLIKPGEYKQMAGRAGRRGIDTIGHVIILPLRKLSLVQEEYEIMLTGKVASISSKLNYSYDMLLHILGNEINMNDFMKDSLFMKQVKGQRREIQENLDILTQDKQNLATIEDPQILEKIERYEELKSKIQGGDFGGLKLAPKTINKYKQEQKKILTALGKDSKKLLELYENKKSVNEAITKNSDNLYYYDNMTEIEINKMTNLLVGWKYINFDEGNISLLPKGKVASIIYECNCILFTEMYVRGIFKDLDCYELIAILALLTENKERENCMVELKLLTPIVTSKIKLIENISKEAYELEKRSNYYDDDYWAITYEFCESGYLWAKGKNFPTVKDNYKGINLLYEGNFVKIMLKIVNLSNSLHNICYSLDKDPYLLSELEKIEGLIMRDIVNVDSIYI